MTKFTKMTKIYQNFQNDKINQNDENDQISIQMNLREKKVEFGFELLNLPLDGNST